MSIAHSVLWLFLLLLNLRLEMKGLLHLSASSILDILTAHRNSIFLLKFVQNMLTIEKSGMFLMYKYFTKITINFRLFTEVIVINIQRIQRPSNSKDASYLEESNIIIHVLGSSESKPRWMESVFGWEGFVPWNWIFLLGDELKAFRLWFMPPLNGFGGTCSSNEKFLRMMHFFFKMMY